MIAPAHNGPRAHRRSSRRSIAVGTVIAVGAAGLVALAPQAAAVPVALPTAAPDLGSSVVDGFDSEPLDPRWSITNETPAAWSLSSHPGALTLTAQTGDTYQTNNTARNVFMVDIPDGDFTAITQVSAPVSKVYQGAGLIAWSDMDNYVRSGLTYVGPLAPSGVAVETDVETAANFSAVAFEDRPGSTGETLRLQRTGDVITSSVWNEAASAWTTAATTTVGFDVTQIGVYALAALDGTTFDAVFDYFAYQAVEGQDVVPAGSFTLRAAGDAPYLVTDGNQLALTDVRPASTLTLTATAVAAQPGVVTLASGELPVVLTPEGDVVLGEPDDPATGVRLTDAGGGKLYLHRADSTDADGYVGGQTGPLTVGPKSAAARFTLQEISVAADGSLDIDGDATAIEMSQDLYGIFYEDINYAADGGLYAELVRNRSFEFNTSDNTSFNGLTAWQPLTRDAGAGSSATVGTDDNRLNDTNRYYLTLTATGAGAGIRNAGFNNGIALKSGASYDFSVWARSAVAQDLTVRLEDTGDTATYAVGTVAVDGSDTWKKYTLTLTSTGTTDAARLAVLAGAPSTVRLDQVSLFPTDTWVGPVNGRSVLRKDLAEKIVDLEPKFLRFPGGCVTNVGTFRTYSESGYTDRRRTYQWKETIGPVEERATNYNFWGYNQSYGIGYLEYFELAEDLGAIALPVLSVGANGCGSTVPEMKDDATIARWVQDTLDLIEFATGDTSTEWGAKRAALGHPEPFEMKWIGLGNEENTTTFEANFPKFRDAIEAVYPDIQIISNSGPDDTGARFDTLWAFNRAQDVDLVDEHYYNDPDWFLTNTERYDSYDRNGPAVFLGEYASRGNTLWNALTEAAYMTGLERNADIVKLASYAPLLANESYVQWSPDAIWFDNDESWLTPNYHVQQMFSANQGDQLVPSTYAGPSTPENPISGGVFLSTWATSARYDNVTVKSNDSGATLFSDEFADASQWSPQSGTWAVTNGAYAQTNTTQTDARSIITGAYDKDWTNYTLELDATKQAGAEGFLVGFGATGVNNFFWWNLGGWNNTRSVLQKAAGGSAGEVRALEGQTLTTGQTYHVKVVVSGRNIKLYLDDVLQMEYTDSQATQPVFSDVTRDADTGDLVVKVVNTSAQVRPTQINLSDVGIEPTGTATVLAGSPTDVNTKANPDAIAPVDYPLSGLSPSFTYSFEPYSVTFLRLHTTDVTAPAIDAVEVDGTAVNGWYADPVTVTATASDDRGVALIESQIDGGAWVPAAGTDSASVTVTGHGVHTVSFRATDAAGNVSEIRPTVVQIDTAAPVSNSQVDLKSRKVTLRAADSGAGVARIEYRLGTAGAWSAYTSPITIGAAATTVQYRGVDGLGNTEAPNTIVVPKAGVVLKGTATVAGLLASTVPYGTKAKVTVKVTGSGGTPTGTIRVTRGATLVGSGTLSAGKATITLSGAIPVGRSTLTVSYGGNAVFAGSTDTVVLTVTRATSSTTVAVTPSSITASTKPVVRITVTSPTTKVDGRATVVVVRTSSPKGIVVAKTVALAGGKASLTLPRQPKGSYSVAIGYQGSSTVATSKATTSFTVR